MKRLRATTANLGFALNLPLSLPHCHAIFSSVHKNVLIETHGKEILLVCARTCKYIESLSGYPEHGFKRYLCSHTNFSVLNYLCLICNMLE